MNMQLSNHQIIISTLAEILGKCSASDLLSKCIYAVQIGSNDYLNNYFIPEFYNTSRLYTPEEYAAYLIEQYSQQIKVAMIGETGLDCFIEIRISRRDNFLFFLIITRLCTMTEPGC